MLGVVEGEKVIRKIRLSLTRLCLQNSLVISLGSFKFVFSEKRIYFLPSDRKGVTFSAFTAS